MLARDHNQPLRRPVSVARVAASTALLAKKKKGRGGGNNEGAQPRERKEKDDVIEVCGKIAINLPKALQDNPTQNVFCSVFGSPAPHACCVLVNEQALRYLRSFHR